MMQVTGAILAGGRSSRMGTPKHAIALADERTMLDHSADSLQRVCPRFVICGPLGDYLAQGRDYVTVRDLRPDLGPLGGLEALLASGMDQHYLVIPCDTPLITPGLLQKLLRPTSAIAMVFQIAGRGEFEPLPLRICAEALPVLRSLLDEGRRGVHQLVAAVPHEMVAISAEEAAFLRNINTPADLTALKERMLQSGSPRS